MPAVPSDPSASEQIDAMIKASPDWRGALIAQLRAIITAADPALIEEVKWKKPSKPEGVAVWVRQGNVCIAETLKNTVRLTFPQGAQLPDPQKLFNARLDGNAVRAIDYSETSVVDADALAVLVRAAVALNASASK